MVECNRNNIRNRCSCTYSSCDRKGKCCECVQYHLRSNELPGCIFAKISKDAEKSYDRSFEYFANLILNK